MIVNMLTNEHTEKNMKENKFGSFLRECRGKLSLQKLANMIGCSKPYLWDIEKGNTKPPQKYNKLNDIANALNLDADKRNKLFDLASDNDDVPADIKLIIKNNKGIVKMLRNDYNVGESVYEK